MYKERRNQVFDIVQGFCFKNSYTNIVQEFSSYLTDCIIRLLEKNNLTLDNLLSKVKKRNDFFVANDIKNKKDFAKNLNDKLAYELSFYNPPSFYDSIVEFKRKMENGIAKDFFKDKLEAPLRGCLATYVREENFCEARSSSGNNDICVPSEKVVIETKIWRGKEYYHSGFPELEEYLDKNNYKEGYYVIFDFDKKNNEVIMNKGEVFEIEYSNKLVHVFFIKMNRVSPSQKYKSNK